MAHAAVPASRPVTSAAYNNRHTSSSSHRWSSTAAAAPALPARRIAVNQQQSPPSPPPQQQEQRNRPPNLNHLVYRHLRRRLAAGGAGSNTWCDPADTARLQRKLTGVLRDSTSSAGDVADVLLVSDACGCLNAIHVAAALARLVRLEQASEAAAATATAGEYYYAVHADGSSLPSSEAAAAGGYSSSGTAADLMMSAVVPLSAGQRVEMGTIHDALPRAAQVAAAAAGSPAACFSWHLEQEQQPYSSSSVEWADEAAEDEVDNDEYSLLDEQEQELQQHLIQQLSAAAEALWPSMSAATITSVAWSLAHLQHQPSERLLLLAGGALSAMADSLVVLEPHQQQQQQEEVLSASPRQVVVLMWALAKITPNLCDIAGTPQQQQGSVGDASHSSSSFLHHILLCLTPHMPDLSTQGLLLLMWAAATWSQTATRSSSSTSDISHTSYGEVAAAAQQLLPGPVAAGLLSASLGALESQALAPRGVAVVMWSAARLCLTPDSTWLGAWFAAMHDALPAAGPQDVTVAAWGLARMGCPPPVQWLAALSRRAAAVAPGMAARELPALLWAYARLRYRPPAPALHALLHRGGRLAAEGSLSPQGLALLLWCSGALGVELPGRWLDGVLAAAAGYLPLFQPVDASALWIGLVGLQHIPPAAWLEVWWAGSKGLLVTAGGQQLVLLLWAAVQLGQAPPSSWLRAWLSAAQRAMSRGELTGQGYGIMWDALGQLAPTGLPLPADDWLATYFDASSQARVLQQLDPLAVERTLCGLAAVSGQLQQDVVLPPQWLGGMLAASLQLLPGAKLITIAKILQAAGQQALPLPPMWLAAAMARVQQLLVYASVLQPSLVVTADAASSSMSGSSRSSSPSGGRSLVLSARLERQWTEACLQRVLYGLRAQQMLNPVAQRRLWGAAAQAATAALWGDDPAAAGAAVTGTVGAGDDASEPHSSSSSDVLAVWPWLSPAVYSVWSDRSSAQQALQALDLR